MNMEKLASESLTREKVSFLLSSLPTIEELGYTQETREGLLELGIDLPNYLK